MLLESLKKAVPFGDHILKILDFFVSRSTVLNSKFGQKVETCILYVNGYKNDKSIISFKKTEMYSFSGKFAHKKSDLYDTASRRNLTVFFALLNRIERFQRLFTYEKRIYICWGVRYQ